MTCFNISPDIYSPFTDHLLNSIMVLTLTDKEKHCQYWEKYQSRAPPRQAIIQQRMLKWRIAVILKIQLT
jgi:hypothetical protein